MNAPKTPLVGPGYSQWNAATWFGSSLGGSSWMLVTAYFLLVHGQMILASIPTAGFALVWIASALLWSRRDYIYPFSALLMLLGLLAITFPVVWCVVQSRGSQSVLAAMNWPESRWMTILVFAIVPAGMIWFFVLEKISRTGATKTKPNSNAAT